MIKNNNIPILTYVIISSNKNFLNTILKLTFDQLDHCIKS